MPSGKIFLRPPVLLALCLISIGGIVTLVGRLATGPVLAFKLVELSNEAGVKAYPAFSPDGHWLAYSARGTSAQDEGYHIFVRDMIAGKSQQLTSGDASDVSPAWSPDGAQIAFVRLSDDLGACMVMPSTGGEPQSFPGCAAPGEEAQPLPALAWSHDGQSLIAVQASDSQPAALALLSLASGKFQPISHPPAGAEDSTPALSPDGASLAFVRSLGPDRADIFVSDPAGAHAHALTFDGRPIRGIAWTREGQDLVYSSQRARGWRIWRLPVYGGSPHDLILSAHEAQYVAIAPAGNRLVYTANPTVSSIWRAELGKGEDIVEHAIIRSTGNENCPRYSPDGKSIADISNQTGDDEIWISDADGGNRVQVTSLKAVNLARIRWSPDGKTLLFDATSNQDYDLYAVPAAAGAAPVRLKAGALNGSWSHDGKTVYYQSGNRTFKMPAGGGTPQELTSMDISAQPVESADGKWIYFRSGRSFWRVPIEGGKEEQAIIPEHDLMWSTTLQPTRQGMYYIEYERSAGEPVVSFYDYAQKRSSTVFHLKRGGYRDAVTYSVSPDGKSILYARVDKSQTNFELVENFR